MGVIFLSSNHMAMRKASTFSFDNLHQLYAKNSLRCTGSKKKSSMVMSCCSNVVDLISSSGPPAVLTARAMKLPLLEASSPYARSDQGAVETLSRRERNDSRTAIAAFHDGLGIVEFLGGKYLLITGATGFLAKVLIEKILRVAPGVGKIYVLIKAKSKEAAADRLKSEIINSELFRRLRQVHGRNYQAFMQDKLVPLAGNVSEANLGMHADLIDEVSAQVDVIVNSAANTTFDERYDVALDINTVGPCRLMRFARRCQKLKLFLQVSTAYVNGQREGKILENAFSMGDSIAGEKANPVTNSIPKLSLEAELKLALDTRRSTHLYCNEQAQAMKDLGLKRARTYGWQDTYVFTKAMGEMVINDMKGDIPTVTIRPSVIESTYKEPFPGWMEGNRMMDPIILYYGKGQLTGFLADPSGVLDVVPADMVVNATLAAMAKHGVGRRPGMHIYHVTSSAVNPLGFQDLADHLFKYFSSSPYVDSTGKVIHVNRMKLFLDMDEFSSHISAEAVERISRTASHHAKEKLAARLKSICMKSVEQANYLAKIYMPYTFYGGRFDNTNTCKLLEEMSDEERRTFSFDVERIDWKDYISSIHIPGLRRHVWKGRGNINN